MHVLYTSLITRSQVGDIRTTSSCIDHNRRHRFIFPYRRWWWCNDDGWLQEYFSCDDDDDSSASFPVRRCTRLMNSSGLTWIIFGDLRWITTGFIILLCNGFFMIVDEEFFTLKAEWLGRPCNLSIPRLVLIIK